MNLTYLAVLTILVLLAAAAGIGQYVFYRRARQKGNNTPRSTGSRVVIAVVGVAILAFSVWWGTRIN